MKPKFVEHKSTLRTPKRYITGFDNDGRSIITNESEVLKWTDVCDTSTGEYSGQFSLIYATKGFPVNISQNKDIDFYNQSLKNGISITVPNGNVLRVVDMAPGSTSPMHGTSSIDYGIVLHGEVEAMLDSGESVFLQKDDILVQRGTMHAWKNTSSTEYARMIYSLNSANPIEINGRILEEDLGDIGGIPRNES